MALPAEIPETDPVASTVAIAGLIELHEPPGRSYNSVVALTHTLAKPDIATGNGLTVTALVAVHPVFSVYDTTTTPAESPVSRPERGAIPMYPATAVLQVPPRLASVRILFSPTQIPALPVIAAGNGFTVTGKVLKHPVGNA